MKYLKGPYKNEARTFAIRGAYKASTINAKGIFKTSKVLKKMASVIISFKIIYPLSWFFLECFFLYLCSWVIRPMSKLLIY